MANPSKFPSEDRYEDRVILASVLVGIGTWILDAALDAWVFGQNEFLHSLLLEVSPHEVYFRLFVMVVIFIFGLSMRGTLVRRREAEEELRHVLAGLEYEKARTDAVIAAIPDGISILDRNYHVIYQNEVHRELVGDQLGKVCYEKYAQRDSICPGCPVAATYVDGGNHVLLKNVPNGNGGMRYIEIRSSPLKNAANEIVACIEAVRDITVRKRAEEELTKHRERLEELVEERTRELTNANVRLQREIGERERIESQLTRVQKLESLGLLAGGIAHDFGNLLGSVMGNISLAILDVDPASPARQQLIKAEAASLRAQELIRQLLTFSRGGMPVKKLLSLPGLITEAAGLSLRGSRVLHELTIPGDLWSVEADDGQVMQVLSNVLINADQSMPDGGIIRITAQNVTLDAGDIPPLGAGRYVKVSIRDEGTGIPEENLFRIFDPFFTTKKKGSGLGLATSYSIIRKHEGIMTVESEPGKGTTFHLYLPASQGDASFSSRDDTYIKGSGHILIMDDEEDMRNTTGDMLMRLGYSVDFAGDGGEAIAKYRGAREGGRPFDAVIMDLTVPGGMGGREAIRQLLAIDPDARAIVSSGYSDDTVLADHRSFGFRGVVRKPYRLRDLSEVVAAVLRDGERRP
jgi:signal transduction histidine kinase/ActR/RegA family two-component response regulator